MASADPNIVLLENEFTFSPSSLKTLTVPFLTKYTIIYIYIYINEQIFICLDLRDH